MKYLDEQIEVTMSGFTSVSAKTYQYRVLDYDNTIIYVGNIYISDGVSSVNIDITDIVSNQKWDGNEIVTPIQNIGNKKVNILNRYRVALYINGNTSDPIYSDYVDVAMVYRYPNHSADMESVFADNWYATNVNIERNCLQGVINEEPILAPRIPFIKTHNYCFAFAEEVSKYYNRTSTAHYLKAYGGVNSDEGLMAYFDVPSSINVIPLDGLFYDTSASFEIDDYTTNLSGGFEKNTDVETVSFVGIAHEEWEDRNIQVWIGDTIVGTYPLSTSNTHIDVDIEGSDITDGNIYIGVDKNGMPLIINLYDEDFESGQIHISFDSRYMDWLGNNMVYVDDLKVSKSMSGVKAVLKWGENKVADIDYDCIPRYYLMWQDRFGGFQSQPFSKNDVFSIKYSREEMKNYRNRRRYVNMTVQPSWKVNSDWIDERFYPYYESILVSPYLLLYDTKEDKSYNVLVTENTYTEKNFKNQHKMFNLQLNLELDKVQNLLY